MHFTGFPLLGDQCAEMICTKSWSYMHQVLYFGMFPYPFSSISGYHVGGFNVQLFRFYMRMSIWMPEKKEKQINKSTMWKKWVIFGPSLSLARLVFSVFVRNPFLWTWLVTFLYFLNISVSSKLNPSNLHEFLQGYWRCELGWDAGMKVSDQNGGGECVLMKIKSAEKKHTQNSNLVFVCFCLLGRAHVRLLCLRVRLLICRWSHNTSSLVFL